MSCACGDRRRWQDVDRIRGLAKTWAKMENETVVLYRRTDGTYDFSPIDKNEPENEIVEYITPY